jgi:predicted regulator of Ras-like GTPase activity (Roadblock/LC7/MglB family)
MEILSQYAGATMADEGTRLLKKFIDEEGLEGAFAATRSGSYITGIVPEHMHKDTYIAMTAIIHGGAETLSMEMRTPIDYVIVRLSSTTLLVTGLGAKAILGIVGTSHKIDSAMIQKAKDLAKVLEKHIH